MAKFKTQEEIICREDLYDFLGNRMQHSFSQIHDMGYVEKGNFYVKSFLLECDWTPNVGESESEIKYLKDIFSVVPEGRKTKSSEATVSRTDENGFYIISWNWNNENVILYLDTLSDINRRFWYAYSISSAKNIDEILERLIETQTHLDRIWLWTNLLKEYLYKGEPKLFRFEHDDSVFSTNINTKKDPFRFENSGDSETVKEVFNLIENHPKLSKMASISKIRAKYLKSAQKENFSIETLYFNGKTTTIGTSFLAHKQLIQNVVETYSGKVKQIEDNYIVDSVIKERNLSIEGEPIVILYEKSYIKDIDHFCSVVFSGQIPFKLWGNIRPTLNNKGRNVLAVDLHNGAKIFFEIYSDMMSIYLSPGACGNTAVRFFTNLQRTCNLLVSVEDGTGQQLF